jgi:hypothetical protein
MSGYFDALMRSSGIATRAKPRLAHAEPNAGEESFEHEPASAQAATTRKTMAPARAIIPPEPVEPVGWAVPPPLERGTVTNDSNDGIQAELAGAAQSRAEAMASTESPPSPSAQAVEMARPDLAQTLIQVATRWVADAPKQIDNIGQTAQAHGHSLRVPAEAVPALAPADFQHSVRSPRTSEASLIVPIPQSPRDEIVEVSIGAIHLRVDAPTPHTVARPAASPPAITARTANAMPQRSALSRRALRRI